MPYGKGSVSIEEKIALDTVIADLAVGRRIEELFCVCLIPGQYFVVAIRTQLNELNENVEIV